jgi:hypothetical protein
VRREIVPDVAGERIGRERRAGVRLQQRHGYAQLGGQVVAGQKIVAQRDLPHLALELVALRVLPVVVPAAEVAGPGATLLREEPECLLGELARMTPRARVGEHGPAALERRLVRRQERIAAGCVLQIVRLRGREEEQRDVRRLRFSCFPVTRIAVRDGDLERRELRAADERPEMREPLLAEETDIDEHAVQRAECADRVRAVLQHARREHGSGRLVELRERAAGGHVLVQVLVVALAAFQRFLAPAPCKRQPRAQVVDRVHRPRIVHVVGRHERRVERAGPRRME